MHGKGEDTQRVRAAPPPRRATTVQFGGEVTGGKRKRVIHARKANQKAGRDRTKPRERRKQERVMQRHTHTQR